MNVLKRNHVKVYGSGEKTLLFAHGYGCDQNMWRHVAPSFVEGSRVILFDHMGAGYSDTTAYQPHKYEALDGYVNDMLEVCEATDAQNVHFVGHSVGAMMGVLAAIAQPQRFSKLALVAPSPCYMDDGDYVGGFSRSDIDELLETLEDNYLGWATSMAPRIMGNFARPDLGVELTHSFCRSAPAITTAFARVTFLSDHRSALAKVDLPSLILQCNHDFLARLVVGDYVCRHMKNARLVCMRASGHCPNLSAPEETIAVLQSFL